MGKIVVPLTAGQPVVYKLGCHHGEGKGRVQLPWAEAGAPLAPLPDSAYVDAWGRFLANDGKPADWWLTLTERWRGNLRKSLL